MPLIFERSSVGIIEGTGQVSYTVAMLYQPSADVTVFISGLTSSTEPDINRGSITFTPQNWNIPQTIIITSDADEDATSPSYRATDFYELLHRCSSTDSLVNNAERIFHFAVFDPTPPAECAETGPGFCFYQNGKVIDRLFVNEGDDVTYEIRLTENPSGFVFLNLTQSGGSGTGSSGGKGTELGLAFGTTGRNSNNATSGRITTRSHFVTVRGKADPADTITETDIVINHGTTTFGSSNYRGVTKSLPVTKTEPSGKIVSLSSTPSQIKAGETSQITVTLGEKTDTDLIVPLSLTGGGHLVRSSRSPSITVPAGKNTATYDLETNFAESFSGANNFPVNIDIGTLPTGWSKLRVSIITVTIIHQCVPSTFSLNPTSVREGGNFALTLSREANLIHSPTVATPVAISLPLTFNPVLGETNSLLVPSTPVAIGIESGRNSGGLGITTRADPNFSDDDQEIIPGTIAAVDENVSVSYCALDKLTVTVTDRGFMILARVSLSWDEDNFDDVEENTNLTIDEGSDATIYAKLSSRIGVNVTIPVVVTYSSTVTKDDFSPALPATRIDLVFRANFTSTSFDINSLWKESTDMAMADARVVSFQITDAVIVDSASEPPTAVGLGSPTSLNLTIRDGLIPVSIGCSPIKVIEGGNFALMAIRPANIKDSSSLTIPVDLDPADLVANATVTELEAGKVRRMLTLRAGGNTVGIDITTARDTDTAPDTLEATIDPNTNTWTTVPANRSQYYKAAPDGGNECSVLVDEHPVHARVHIAWDAWPDPIPATHVPKTTEEINEGASARIYGLLVILDDEDGNPYEIDYDVTIDLVSEYFRGTTKINNFADFKQVPASIEIEDGNTRSDSDEENFDVIPFYLELKPSMMMAARKLNISIGGITQPATNGQIIAGSPQALTLNIQNKRIPVCLSANPKTVPRGSVFGLEVQRDLALIKGTASEITLPLTFNPANKIQGTPPATIQIDSGRSGKGVDITTAPDATAGDLTVTLGDPTVSDPVDRHGSYQAGNGSDCKSMEVIAVTEPSAYVTVKVNNVTEGNELTLEVALTTGRANSTAATLTKAFTAVVSVSPEERGLAGSYSLTIAAGESSASTKILVPWDKKCASESITFTVAPPTDNDVGLHNTRSATSVITQVRPVLNISSGNTGRVKGGDDVTITVTRSKPRGANGDSEGSHMPETQVPLVITFSDTQELIENTLPITAVLPEYDPVSDNDAATLTWSTVLNTAQVDTRKTLTVRMRDMTTGDNPQPSVPLCHAWGATREVTIPLDPKVCNVAVTLSASDASPAVDSPTTITATVSGTTRGTLTFTWYEKVEGAADSTFTQISTTDTTSVTNSITRTKDSAESYVIKCEVERSGCTAEEEVVITWGPKTLTVSVSQSPETIEWYTVVVLTATVGGTASGDISSIWEKFNPIKNTWEIVRSSPNVTGILDLVLTLYNNGGIYRIRVDRDGLTAISETKNLAWNVLDLISQVSLTANKNLLPHEGQTGLVVDLDLALGESVTFTSSIGTLPTGWKIDRIWFSGAQLDPTEDTKILQDSLMTTYTASYNSEIVILFGTRFFVSGPSVNGLEPKYSPAGGHIIVRWS